MTNFLRHLSEWWGDPRGVWPWAEHNQGTLTVAALVLALSIAIYELRRAARSEERDACAFIDFVLRAADRGIELTRDAILTCDGRASEVERVSPVVWDFLQGNASATLREVLPIRPSVPDLVFLVNGLDRMLAIRPDNDLFQQGERTGFLAILEMLEIQREKIARLRPPSDLERLCRWRRLSGYRRAVTTPLADSLKHPLCTASAGAPAP